MEENRASIAQVLKERLPAAMFDRLHEVSRGFSLPIFSRDPRTGRFECILDDDSQEPDELLADAACLACELLSDSGRDFRGDRSVAAGVDEAGEIVLEYRFEPGEEAVYESFRKGAADLAARDPGLKVREEKNAAGRRLLVRLRYASDFDYQRKKDSLDWMLDLARKRAKNSPFSGQKL